MRNWLEQAARNPKVVQRLEYLFNHTLSGENADAYPTLADAAEVFGLLYLAYTVGFDDVAVADSLADRTPSESLVGPIMLGRVRIDTEKDWFQFEEQRGISGNFMIELY